jgi:hypothetical protein
VSTARYRRSTLIRQRQALTHFIDKVEEERFEDKGGFSIALKENASLFRYNLGPEGEGFRICHDCGCSEPAARKLLKGRHERLRASAGSMDCPHTFWAKPIAYGHEFSSSCLVIRPLAEPVSVESLAFALQAGLCRALELEISDIGTCWRWAAERSRPEIVLYDRAPGGSGFVREAEADWLQVLKCARDICERCACDAACYGCLKHYGNQSYHELLNRNLALKSF